MSTVKKYIGTSLSFCVQDILRGNINIAEISAIVTSTAFQTQEEAIEAYKNSYWSEYGETIIADTISEIWHLVFQPRLKNMYEHRGHYAGHGYWLNTQTGEYTKGIPVEEQ